MPGVTSFRWAVSYTTEESVFDLLQGLPDRVDWEIFCKLMLSKLSLNPSLSSPSPGSSTTTFSFSDASKLLLKKANAIVGQCKLAGPGLEYVNAAVKSRKTNPTTGVHIHKNNPSSVCCVNPLCTGKSWAKTPDKDHCYWPGGGMESQAPPWAHPCGVKAELAVVAAVGKVEALLCGDYQDQSMLRAGCSCLSWPFCHHP